MVFNEREWHVNVVDEGLVDTDGKSVLTTYVTATGYGDHSWAAEKCASGTYVSDISHGSGSGFYLSVNSIDSFTTGPEVTYTAVTWPLNLDKIEIFKKNEKLYRVTVMIEWALGGGGAATVTVPAIGFYQGGKKTIKYKGKTLFTGMMYKNVEWKELDHDDAGDEIEIPWSKTTYVDKVNEIGRAYVCKKMFFPGKTVQSNIHPEVTTMNFSLPPDPPGSSSCSYGDIAEACFAAAGVQLGGKPDCPGRFEAGLTGKDNDLVWSTCSSHDPMPLSQVVQWITNMSGSYVYADAEGKIKFYKPVGPAEGGGDPNGGATCAGSSGNAYDGALDFKSIACYCQGDQQLVGNGLPCGFLIDNTKNMSFLVERANEILLRSAKACVSTCKIGNLDSIDLVPGNPYRSYSVNASFLVSLRNAESYKDDPIDLFDGVDTSNSVEVVF